MLVTWGHVGFQIMSVGNIEPNLLTEFLSKKQTNLELTANIVKSLCHFTFKVMVKNDFEF